LQVATIIEDKIATVCNIWPSVHGTSATADFYVATSTGDSLAPAYVLTVEVTAEGRKLEPWAPRLTVFRRAQDQRCPSMIPPGRIDATGTPAPRSTRAGETVWELLLGRQQQLPCFRERPDILS